MTESRIGVGVDVGGTTVKLGLFSERGELLKKWEIPTDHTDDCANLIPDIAASIRGTLSREGIGFERLMGAGMGVPGPVQADGYVEVCVNLHWKNRYPARELSELLSGIPCFLANDANAAALGEAWKGGGSGAKEAVLITLGTGVGGGVIMNGHIVPGRHGLGGEIGHALQTVVMTTSIIYEFIGPVSAKLSLSLSGAVSNKLEDVVPEVEEGMTSVEELIERIRIIHEMNEKNDLVKEQEKVFTEAADELYRIPAISRNMRRRNR